MIPDRYWFDMGGNGIDLFSITYVGPVAGVDGVLGEKLGQFSFIISGCAVDMQFESVEKAGKARRMMLDKLRKIQMDKIQAIQRVQEKQGQLVDLPFGEGGKQ